MILNHLKQSQMIISNWFPNCGNEFTVNYLHFKAPRPKSLRYRPAIENARSINTLVMNSDLNILKYLCKSLSEAQLI